MANVAIFQIALAMKFFEIWPQFSWQMWPYLAFGKNMLISGPFGLILGPFWPNFTFQFNIHKRGYDGWRSMQLFVRGLDTIYRGYL